MTLLGFLLLRDLPFPPLGLPRNLSSHELSHQLRSSAGALQSVTGRKFSWTLSSPPPLPRFATFPAFLILHGFNVSGLPLRDLRMLPPFSFPS